jgi:hypothetical protein
LPLYAISYFLDRGRDSCGPGPAKRRGASRPADPTASRFVPGDSSTAPPRASVEWRATGRKERRGLTTGSSQHPLAGMGSPAWVGRAPYQPSDQVFHTAHLKSIIQSTWYCVQPSGPGTGQPEAIQTSSSVMGCRCWCCGVGWSRWLLYWPPPPLAWPHCWWEEGATPWCCPPL